RVADHLFSTNDSKLQTLLLRVFGAAALLIFDSRLIGLCQSEDDSIQRHAFNALAQNAHPEIRAFALKEMQEKVDDAWIAELFVKNYEPRDEDLLLNSLVLPDDPWELHWLLSDLLKVLEANELADVSKLALIVYGSTPCEVCRFHAIKLLL